MQTKQPKNILYIAPYRQHDGWGLASRDYLLALLSTHHNVVPVSFYTNRGAKCVIDNKQILNAEKESYTYYDYVIQKSMPQSFVYNGDFGKNIGLTVIENNRFFSSGIASINIMDQLLVPSLKEKNALINSGVRIPISTISQPIDTNLIKNHSSKVLDMGLSSNTFKFYFIGEYIQRKNIKDIIIAFNLEFDINEPVELIIKTSMPGLTSEQAKQHIEQDIVKLKTRFRIKNKYKTETIITKRLSDLEMQSLHKTCDCFVAVSYGEAFCRPAAEAVCSGNTTILSDGIGISEMLDADDFYHVQSSEQPVIMEDTTYVNGLDFYNANETWFIPSVMHLRQQMRSAFNDKKTVSDTKYLERFSYNNIGQQICQSI
jgi:glycosyltransferase involved in cell wall biosynthesis